MRRLLVGWLLGGATVGTLGFLFMFDRRSPPAPLITGVAFGGLAVVCIAVLVIWLRVAMRSAERDQA